MTSEQFFKIFLEELAQLPELYHYYKFLENTKRFEFRKSYFIQRLDYVLAQVKAKDPQKTLAIWDCGCGYGTTCLFLAMNGYKSYGTTLEFYFPFIEKRKKYWQQYGDASLFSAGYENLYDEMPKAASVDIIVVQDTLHHLEPIDKAIEIFYQSLRTNGILIAVEENGDNVVQNLKLYKQRGNKRIIDYYDERLKKTIKIGNENIRGIAKWKQLFEDAGFIFKDKSLQYVRLLPPLSYKGKTAESVTQREQAITQAFLRKYFFFGINFVAER
jgi:SAM-dependent methyltransferase